ncbi:MAG: glycosyl transferase [Ignavibacteria bacterium]|nr:glycosyl transferase [Ignavibacteria bacterium]
MNFIKNTENIEIELSIVMPCLDEAETIADCVAKARKFLETNNIKGEVIVADNGSIDGSQQLAINEGARIVDVPMKGYGSALRGGITAAYGKFVIMGDSDGSHDLENLMQFVEMLRNGYDMVIGNRFKGESKAGSLSYLPRLIGNQSLSLIGKIFYRSPVSDFHCGLRGFTKEAFIKLDLRTTGMEFASEMIVKSSFIKLKVAEVPTKIFPSGRSRPAHLRPIHDGWRHLRFLLLYSPRWLFLYPGISFIIFGICLGLLLLPGIRFSLDFHTLLYASTALIIGFQAVSFAILSKVFAIQEKLLPEHERLMKLLKPLTLERGLFVGSLMVALGLGGSVYAVIKAEQGQFGALGLQSTMRLVITSITLLVLGCQIIFSSFFLSILKLKLHK